MPGICSDLSLNISERDSEREMLIMMPILIKNYPKSFIRTGSENILIDCENICSF